MPELTEVEITRQKLLPAVLGRRVSGFFCDWPRGLKGASPASVRRDITGRTIESVTRHGKALFFKLSDKPERAMAIHLRMSGRLAVTKSAKEGKGSKGSKASDGRWVHFRWRLSPRHGSGQAGRVDLRFVDPRKFGIVWYGSPAALARDSYLGALGPDAAGISRQTLHAALRQTRGMVKAALLRQDVIAGIGNIIADESLWRARIHPRAALENIEDAGLNRFHRSLAQTLRAMRKAGGTSLRNWGEPSGRLGRYQDARLVYGRSGKPCPRCRTRLTRLVVAGRGTTVCPNCQRLQTALS